MQAVEAAKHAGHTFNAPQIRPVGVANLQFYCIAFLRINTALDAFQIGIVPVTQRQYRAVMGDNPSFFSGDDERPVELIDAYKAVIFCNRLSKAAGFDPTHDEETTVCDFAKSGFRLPTEAEWEYACRAGTRTLFYTGDIEEDMDRAGWYLASSGGATHPVGRKEPNAWGLYDMHGNVWEYVYGGMDREWSYDWYTPEEQTNPRRYDRDFDLRMVRGGNWFTEPYACRSAARSVGLSGYGTHYQGFRVARSLR